MYVGFGAALREDGLQLLVAGGPRPPAGPAVGEDLQPDDVLVRLAGTRGGGTAGVVADRPAQCAVAVRGRAGGEWQPVRLQLRDQLIQDAPRIPPAGMSL